MLAFIQRLLPHRAADRIGLRGLVPTGIDPNQPGRSSSAFVASMDNQLRLREHEPVPDHSWLSRTRARLPLEVHDAVFTWVLQRLAERGLIKGERIGVDASTVKANAALRAIVRRDGGESYREMLVRMAKESGIETPTAEDLIRLDRKGEGKTLSNAEWESPTDPDARFAKLKDGRTHLAYKPEHALDLDTGAVVAAEMHVADRGYIGPCPTPWRVPPVTWPRSRRRRARRPLPRWWPTRGTTRARC